MIQNEKNTHNIANNVMIMLSKKSILGLLFVFFAGVSHAQDKRVYIPPPNTEKSYSVKMTEVQVDSAFIESLNTILFDKNCRYMNQLYSGPHSKYQRHFHIYFEKIDSMNYSIQIMLRYIPGRNAIGFFEYNEYLYWFGGDVPNGIILGEKSKRQFSYTEDSAETIDPPLWILRYNSQKGNYEVKIAPCD